MKDILTSDMIFEVTALIFYPSKAVTTLLLERRRELELPDRLRFSYCRCKPIGAKDYS